MSTADPIGDERVVAVLGHAAWGVNPILDLVSADPFGIKARTFVPSGQGGTRLDRVLDGVAWLLDVAQVPGTAAWERAGDERRARWWLTRFGTLNTVAVAMPGVLGPLAKRLPLQDLLGFANQTLMLIAVSRELGLTDRTAQVELLASVLCDREIDARTLLANEVPDRAHESVPDRDHESVPDRAHEPARWRPFGAVRGLWVTARVLRSIPDELHKRPQPGQPWRLLGKVPVVGAVADYVGERGALFDAAVLGKRWIDGHTVRTAVAGSGARGTTSV